MPHNIALVVIVAAFALLALAVVLGLFVLLGDAVSPLLARVTHGADLRDWVSDHAPRLGRRREEDGDEEDGDDLQDETAALLAMISDAPIVVDDDGEVLRASPEAYRLGVVDEDTITDDRVAHAVQEVLKDGGWRHLEITTFTPARFARVDGDASDGAAQVATPGAAAAGDGAAVTRPNWVKVTVGRIGERLVVVLLNDVSDSVRFEQIRDDFITNVSEQLVRPTEELSHLAARLERGEVKQDEVRRDARNVRRTINYIEHMVKDLLLLIKAQEQVEPSASNRLHLLAEVEGAVDVVRPQAEERGQRVRVTGDAALTVHGERGQIRSAIGKLVENALEYSPDGATVSLSVGRSKDGRDAVVRVIDRGCGIPLKKQPRIFERFYRGTNQNERTDDGVGLGLAIVKHVALTHHGGVSVWSRPGQGSTFSLVLPLAGGDSDDSDADDAG